MGETIISMENFQLVPEMAATRPCPFCAHYRDKRQIATTTCEDCCGSGLLPAGLGLLQRANEERGKFGDNEYLYEFTKVDGSSNLRAFGKRFALVAEYAWAIPNDEALNALVKLSLLIEIGSGGGYWAWLLKRRGVDIICYDTEVSHPRTKTWIRGQNGGPEVLNESRHAHRTLFLCWPPMTSMAMDCLNNYSGSQLVYVGEEYGCTASDDFMMRLNETGTLNIESIFRSGAEFMITCSSIGGSDGHC